jgi:hypothetical protein
MTRARTRMNQVQASHQRREEGKRKRGRGLAEHVIDVRSELWIGLTVYKCIVTVILRFYEPRVGSDYC